MKLFIFKSIIIITMLVVFNGCYTYLSVGSRTRLAEVPYEPYFPTPDPTPCPVPQPPPPPWFQPIYTVPSPPDKIYERPEKIRDIRNGGENRNPGNTERRR